MRKIVLSMMVVIVLLVGVAAPASSAPAQRETTLKIALLPILDVLPVYVAEQQGYFTDAGLKVEFIPAGSAIERDQLMLAGEVDAMLNDLVSAAIFNQDETRVQIVLQARRAYLDHPQFRILSAPRSNITIPSDLKGVEIGISENSVIHYITQRILENAGLSADDLKFRPEPNIAVRFQLLMEGQLKAGCLPDPLAQAAIAGGATLIAEDTVLVESDLSQSVVTFNKDMIDKNPDAVQAFVGAWMKAAADINADPEAYRALWLEKTTVPDSVKDTYALPLFPLYAITQELAWNDNTAWMVEQGIIDNAPDYANSVNPAFVQAITPQSMYPGDAANGAALFAAQGCIGCHNTYAPPIVGPSMNGITSHAFTRVDGLSAEDYLRQAIVEPGAFVVDGYSDMMPPFANLSDQELNDLVAYLMTFK
jgi:NitT/TauT family transport system substrate-binding protein